MKICESRPVICRASGQASADTLNETCPCLTCDHEAPIVAGAYCMAGNFVDRNTNQNGCGVRENASFTLNTVDRHAVAYDARHHCLGGEVSGTLQAKGEGGWSLNYINPVLQPLPENTVGIDLYNGAVTGNTAATLTKKNDGTSSDPEVAQRKTPDWIVRRLIPMECGRLQGFPDGWAEIEPLTDLRELPFWREVYTKDCEIKGKKPNRKMMQADSEEGRRALMRWPAQQGGRVRNVGQRNGATKRIVLCKERVPRTGKAARRNKAGKPVRWKRNNAAVRRNVRRASGLGKRGRAVPHCCYKDASAEHEASWKRYGHQGLSD